MESLRIFNDQRTVRTTLDIAPRRTVNQRRNALDQDPRVLSRLPYVMYSALDLMLKFSMATGDVHSLDTDYMRWLKTPEIEDVSADGTSEFVWLAGVAKLHQEILPGRFFDTSRSSVLLYIRQPDEPSEYVQPYTRLITDGVRHRTIDGVRAGNRDDLECVDLLVTQIHQAAFPDQTLDHFIAYE